MTKGWSGAGRWVWAAAVVAGAVVAVPASPVVAQTAQSVPPNSVQSLSDPGVTLAVPADGRLNGYGFAGQVLGAATGPSMPRPAGMSAGSGQQLWVFGVRWQADVSGSTVTPVTVTVVADAIRMPATITQPEASSGSANTGSVDSGDEYFVASVPAGAADVVVEMASDGFAQDFSLTHMAREGDPAAALYRSQSSWQYVDQTTTEKNLITPWDQGDMPIADARLQVDLPTVTLSYFGPDGTTDPAPAGDAWLIPQLSDPYQSDDLGGDVGLEYFDPISAAGLTITIPGQAPIHPKLLPGGPDTRPAGIGWNDVFPDQYAFAVPVDLTSATLTVAPGQEEVADGLKSAPQATITVPSATFPLNFPAAYAPTPSAGAATHPAPMAATNAATQTQIGAPHSKGGGGGFPLWVVLAVVGVVIAVAIGIAVLRGQPNPAVADGPAAPPASWSEPQTGWQAYPAWEPPPSEPVTVHDPSAWRQAATTATAPPASAAPVAASQDPAPDGQGPVGPAPDPLVSEPLSESPRVHFRPPQGPPPVPEGTVEVQLYGEPRVVGLADPLSAVLTELACLLALWRGRSPTASQIAAEFNYSREKPLEAETIQRYFNDLRRKRSDLLPRASAGRGYELNATTDTDRFDEYAGIAHSSADPRQQTAALASALALVRGVPFAGVAEGTYNWAFKGDYLAGILSNKVLPVALELGKLALSHGDTDLAMWAARQGLLVWPTTQELHEILVTAAASEGPSALDRACTEVEGRYKAEGEKVPDSLRALMRRLKER